MAQSTTQKIQSILGVKADGVWGPKSQDALNAEIAKTGASNPTLAKIQALIGTTADGQWGTKSQKSLNAALKGQGGVGAAAGGNGPFSATASSFADPADKAAFDACKASGNTDHFCFGKGDNGVGAWGTDTTSTTKAMVAVHEKDAFARWGSWAGAAHRRVRVTINGKSVLATVEDKLGTKGRIDLNPGALAKLGLKPGNLWPCVWEWVV
jgi:hypothetical protein